MIVAVPYTISRSAGLILLLLVVWSAGRGWAGPVGDFEQALERREYPGCSTTAPEQTPPAEPREPVAALQTQKRLVRSAGRNKSQDPTIYTSAQLAALSDVQLVATIANASYNGVSCLWTYDSNVATVLSAAHLQMFATQLQMESSDVVGNCLRIAQLLLMFQMAFYHDYYQAGLSYPPATVTAVQQSMINLAGAANFLTSNEFNVAMMRSQWATSIDNANCVHLVLTPVQSLLQRYWTNRATLLSGYYENTTTYNLMSGMVRQIGNAPATWTNLITSPMLALLGNYATELNPPADVAYISSEAIWLLGTMSALATATKNDAHQLVSQAFSTLPHSGGPFVWAAYALETYFAGKLYNGTTPNMANVRSELKTMLFPNLWKYDQGRVLFKTALPKDGVAPLYDAANEVKSQFLRIASGLTTVAGDTNTTISFVVYASPDQYADYQPFLFNLSTNNGGIYIEQDGTLYTYDRTAQDSIYTLEELVRHEYTHYLDARFNVPGVFNGAGTLYLNAKFLWYVEGLAECCVGGSRTDGLLPRRNLLDQIDSDGPAGRLTLTQLFNATYNDGFKFYRYGGCFMKFLQAQHQELLVPLMTAIRNNDATTVNNWVTARSGDAALQTEFTNWLNGLLTSNAQGKLKCHEDVPTVRTPGVPGGNNATLLNLLKAQTPVGTAPVLTLMGERFRYEEKVTTTVANPATPTTFRNALNALLDGKLKSLTPKQENFAGTVGWYGGLSSSGNVLNAKIYLDGPYSAVSTLKLDHFTWNTIPATVPVNFNFIAAMQARTDLNNIFTAFNGVANLTVTSGFIQPQHIGERYSNYTTFLPLETNANDCRMQTIYLAGEIGTASTITGLALDVDVLPLPMKSWTIRLKHTTLGQFPASGNTWDNTGWTTVYAKDTTINTTGTVKFTFTTPFAYNGTDNLMVDFSFNNNSYGERGEVWYTYTPGVVRSQAAYSYDVDNPLTWAGSTPPPDPMQSFPNIILYGPAAPTITPTQVGFSSGNFYNYLKLGSAATNVRITATDVTGKIIATTNPFNVSGYGLAISAANGSVQRTPSQTAYAAGTQVTLKPVPNAGYKFQKWTGSDVPAGKQYANPLVITMNKHYTLTAVFAKKSTAEHAWSLYE
jgi:hypothetical protein